MKKKPSLALMLSLCSFLAFLAWTLALTRIDVAPIGPRGSSVGFSTVNAAVHSLTGVHMTLYTITDWLGLLPIAIALGFALLGLAQWIRRKRLGSVDRSVLTLGLFYLGVMAVYFFFEGYPINYRPIEINGFLEVSYPSSTTLIMLTVLPTAAMQLKSRIKHSAWRRAVLLLIYALTAFALIARTISGVHWISDIIGGLLISAALDGAYAAVNRF